MKVIVSLFAFTALASVAMAGTETSGRDFKGTSVATAPQECWYGDSEWDVSLWGTYAFTGTEDNQASLSQLFLSSGHQGSYDKYVGDDHAWGGGLDIKYFWHKYFGFGVEGFGLDAKSRDYDVAVPIRGPITASTTTDHRAVGGALGTFTLRYPIGCSRFAPYAWAGAGGIFGGGQHDDFVFDPINGVTTKRSDSESKFMGQFGGGFEVRITRHIGWMNDFSWNVVDGTHNNFGMVRSGLTVAF
jgi:hypothetical protein